MTGRTSALVLAATLATQGGGDPAAAHQPETRPNILWITSEDNAPSLGAYGDRDARTPVPRRLRASRPALPHRVVDGAGLCARPHCSHHRHVPAVDRRRAHAQPGATARGHADVPGAAARRGLLHDQQQQAGLQRDGGGRRPLASGVARWGRFRRRGHGWRVGRLVGHGALAQPPRRAAVLRGLQPRRHPRKPHSEEAGAEDPRSGRGACARLDAGHPRGARRLGRLPRQHDGDGRLGRTPARRARCRRARRRHHRLLFRRQRPGAAAPQTLRVRRRAARAAGGARTGEVPPPGAGRLRRGRSQRPPARIRRFGADGVEPGRPPSTGAHAGAGVHGSGRVAGAALRVRRAGAHGRALRPAACGPRPALRLHPQLHAAPRLRPVPGLRRADAGLAGVEAAVPGGPAEAAAVVGTGSRSLPRSCTT